MAIKDKFSMGDIVNWIFLFLTGVGFIFSIYYTFTNLNYPENINIVLAFPFILFLTPYLFMNLYKLKRVESKMQVIPRFLRDIVDNVESGMDLISSIRSTVNNEYSVLNEDIKKLVNQLSWGIDFDDAILNFATNIGSKSLKRDFLLVIEARSIGGHVEKILRELSSKIDLDNLRTKERKSNLASNTFTGYISFVIFVFIIILVYNNLFVGIATSFNQDANDAQIADTNTIMSVNLTLLMLLSYELAILSGFLFGLMQENNIVAGAPHVVILIIMVFVAFFFFI